LGRSQHNQHIASPTSFGYRARAAQTIDGPRYIERAEAADGGCGNITLGLLCGAASPF
jgi:hypothetical protein